MEINGKVIKILDAQSFTSKKDGAQYTRYSFVLETQEQYPKRVVFTVMGNEKWAQMGIVVDATYSVSFDVNAHEWQGKWFNEVSAWRAVRLDAAQPQAQQQPQVQQAVQAPAPAPSAAPNNNNDDMPF